MPINWFGETLYIHPLLGAGLIATILVIAFFVIRSRGKEFAENTYFCPNCENHFKPKWYNVLTYHVGNDYTLKCPNCKKRDMCSVSWKQDENS